MFTVEYRINGALLGVIYGHNEGAATPDEDSAGLHEYKWHYHDISRGDVITGHVTHRRSDGLQSLVSDIAAAVVARQKSSRR